MGGARCVASEVSPGGSRGDGKGEGRQAQSFKGKTGSARDQGWAAEGEAHFTAVEGDRKGQAAGRAGADWSGWSVPPWKRPGGNWSEDQGGGSGKSCVPGWHSDCTQVSQGVCIPCAPPLPCRGAPTRPLPLQRPHDPLPRPPAQPRLTSVLEPRAPERLGLPSVWAGPGLGSAAGARWAGNVGPACEELTIRCRGQNSHPREPRSSTEKALRGSPQSRETGCGRSPRKDWRGTRWTRGWLPGAGGVGGRLPRRRALLGPRLPGRLPRTPGGMPTEALDAQVWKSEQPGSSPFCRGQGTDAESGPPEEIAGHFPAVAGSLHVTPLAGPSQQVFLGAERKRKKPGSWLLGSSCQTQPHERGREGRRREDGREKPAATF